MAEIGERLIMRAAQASASGLVIRLAARLLFLFVAGRLFGPTAFGAYALAVATVELIVNAGGLGTKKTLFQLLEEGKADPVRPPAHRLIDVALLVAGISLILSAIVVAFALTLPSSLLSPATAFIFVMVAPLAAGQALLDLFLAASRWTHAIKFEVIARSVVEPWSLLAGCAGAWLAGWQAEGLAIGYGIGTSASLLYATLGARHRLGGFQLRHYRPDAAYLASTLRRSGSNATTDVVNGLYIRADIFLVGILLGEAPAGIYNMARQITAPLRQVRQSFDGLLIPLVAKSLATRGAGATSEALASATRLILILQLPYFLAVVITGRPLLETIGPEFAAAYWAMVALAIAETAQSAFSIGDLVFVYLKPGLGLRLTLITILIGVVGALLLIPPLGIAGAALSVLAAHGARGAWRSALLRSRFHFTAGLGHHVAPIAAGVAAGALGLALTLHPLLSLAISLVFYGAAILAWARLGGHKLRLSGFHHDGAN